jgi:hypothetical protein
MSKFAITPFGVPTGGAGTTISNTDTAAFDVVRQGAVTNNAQTNVNATNPTTRPPDLFRSNATAGVDASSTSTSNQPYDYNKYSYSSPQMLQSFEQRERQHIQTLYTSIPGNTVV